MSRFLIAFNKDKAANTEISLDLVKAILQDSTYADEDIKTFSHGKIRVAYSGKVSIHLDESLDILYILSGYFRPAGSSAQYCFDAKAFPPPFDANNNSSPHDVEGCFSLFVCKLSSLDVWLMTDRFGTQPVYYRSSQQYLVVSSEMYPLLPWVDELSISSSALNDSFWLGFSRAPESLISGISKVRNNDLVAIARDGAIVNYEGQSALVMEPDESLEFEDVVSEIEAALDTEFALLGKTLNRVAVLLSGGIDSSIMAAYAKKHFVDCVAFSCEIEGFDNPELERACYVAKKLGLKHEIVKLKLDDLDGIFLEIVSMLEGPSRHINNIVLRKIFGEIRGFDGIIAGEAADSLFGSTLYRTLVNIESKLDLLSRIPEQLKIAALKAIKGVGFDKARKIENLLTKDIEWFRNKQFRIDYSAEDIAFAEKLGVSQFSQLEHSEYKSRGGVGRSVEANFALFLNGVWLRNGFLARNSDGPLYYPFLSEQMLKIGRKLPFKYLFDDAGNAKPALREVCKRNVDPIVTEWPKIGFVTPKKAWLTEELKPFLDRVLYNKGGLTKVMGWKLDRDDVVAVQSSTRLMWWLMTLDASLLELEERFLRWQPE